MAETLASQPGNINPEAQLLLDPNQLPNAQAELAPQLPEQQPLGEVLTKAELSALQTVQHAEPDRRVSAFEVVDRAMQDGHVEEARLAVEGAFGFPEATEVEEVSMREAIDRSDVQTDRRDTIARRAVEGRGSLLQELARDMPVDGRAQDQRTAEQLGVLQETAGANAEHILDHVAKHAREDLKDLDVTGTPLEFLSTEIVRHSGSDLTSVEGAHRAEMQVVGEEVVDALAANRPAISAQAREHIIERLEQNGGLHRIGQLVSRRRSGETISDRSAREAGEILMGGHNEQQAA